MSSTVKISELPVLSSADAADEFVVVDDSAGVTKKITQGDLNVLIANADDYEEGTWTPDLRFGNDNTGITYDEQSGKYLRIDDTVFVSLFIRLSSIGGLTGNFGIFNLPFAYAASFGEFAVVPAGITTPCFARFIGGRIIFNSTAAGSFFDNSDFIDTSKFSLFAAYRTS